LNLLGWTSFYFHWKHLCLWTASLALFEDSSTRLLGWFRDYLWYNSAALINGYNAFGVNDLAVYAWLFLAGHLCWAVSFMFLISWRGFWQELIDSINVMHLFTPIVLDLWEIGSVTPVALSIVQARAVGLWHFAVGYIATYLAFVIASSA